MEIQPAVIMEDTFRALFVPYSNGRPPLNLARITSNSLASVGVMRIIPEEGKHLRAMLLRLVLWRASAFLISPGASVMEPQRFAAESKNLHCDEAILP